LLLFDDECSYALQVAAQTHVRLLGLPGSNWTLFVVPRPQAQNYKPELLVLWRETDQNPRLKKNTTSFGRKQTSSITR
jgi:hypothetical protein